METKKIRVLVIEDSATVRKHLIEILGTDPEIEVVGEASDGKKGVDLCYDLCPDVVTLDMMMPEMNGLEATEQIMAFRPTPILIVSASTNRAELFRTYDALAAGAVEVLEKPIYDQPGADWSKKLIGTVKLISRIKVITHPRAKLEKRSLPSHDESSSLVSSKRITSGMGKLQIVAIGVSTGGPSALVEILKGLPPEFSIPILVVIHIGKPFGEAFAAWLGENSKFPVMTAVDQMPIPSPGKCQVILAPPDQHLVVSGRKLELSLAPERHSCRPSVDVLFESVAKEYGSEAIACLLTGMGRDGADGLLRIRRSGGTTIAQDEASSTVFGMPREAIRLGAAERVLALSEIPHVLHAFEKEQRIERK